MARVTYIEHNGTGHVVQLKPGQTLMEGAIDNSIDGIEAECGGQCACATCHCYIGEEWLELMPPKSPVESDMLEFAADEIRDNSRLGCQVQVTEAMDGLVVHLPEFQI